MSTDAEIATLAREAPHDPLARYRWRCALVRAGRGAEAGFEAGDEVEIEQHTGLGMGCRAGRSQLAIRKEDSQLFAFRGALPHDGSLPSKRCWTHTRWTLLTPAKPKGGGE